MKTNYIIWKLTEKEEEKMFNIVNTIIDNIEKKTNNLEEQAFILRILMETFEETQNCVVPFKNRYTEPVWNYDKQYLGDE